MRDGRTVWVIGEGRVDDLTTHPATRSMVECYVGWYDRHFDPDWRDVLLTPPAADGERLPVAFLVPKSADAADDWIVEHASAGDIAVTADIPLAARLVKKGVHALAPDGRAFTPDSIGMAVAMRDLKQHLRETGELEQTKSIDFTVPRTLGASPPRQHHVALRNEVLIGGEDSADVFITVSNRLIEVGGGDEDDL